MIPFAPLILMIDGLLSRMKGYTLPELENVLRPLRAEYPDFRFRTELLPSFCGLQKITVLSGRPAAEKQNE